jgi:polyphosphate kinase
MQRNLFRRVEIAFPILSEKIKRNLIEIVLDTCLKDNIKARILNSDGNYKLRKELEKEVNEYVNSQEWFMENSESLFVFNGK